MSNLDRMLAAWSAGESRANLGQLEPHVWARLGATERASVASALGFRVALIASVMAVGVVAGGAASATAEPEISPFATHSAYAPSTLLEGGK